VSAQEIYIEETSGEDVTPTLVIAVDTAWQQFSFTNDELRIKVAPGSWIAQNVPVKEQA
jgi:hypothetical protein